MSEPYSAADGLVRVYPGRRPNGAGLVWAHGGGFAFGDLDMPESDAVARALSWRGIAVVSIDYRLAGEGCRYPVPSDDVVAAWSWTLEQADRLRIDRDRLAIGGASAGANLVTGAVLRLLGGEGPALPAAVVLAYPTLHAVQPPTGPELRAALDADPTADRFGPENVRAMYEDYVGFALPVGNEAALPAVPGLATTSELVGFPPTLMINGDVDELRVSGEAFAASLAEAGVDIDVLTEPGTQHGHLNRPLEPGFDVSIDRIAGRLAALSTSPTIPSTFTDIRLTEGSLS